MVAPTSFGIQLFPNYEWVHDGLAGKDVEEHLAAGDCVVYVASKFFKSYLLSSDLNNWEITSSDMLVSRQPCGAGVRRIRIYVSDVPGDLVTTYAQIVKVVAKAMLPGDVVTLVEYGNFEFEKQPGERKAEQIIREIESLLFKLDMHVNESNDLLPKDIAALQNISNSADRHCVRFICRELTKKTYENTVGWLAKLFKCEEQAIVEMSDIVEPTDRESPVVLLHIPKP